MENKVVAKKRSLKRPNKRELAAAEALSDLSRWSVLFREHSAPSSPNKKRNATRVPDSESDNPSEPEATPKKRLTIRFVVGFKSAVATNDHNNKEAMGKDDNNSHENREFVENDQEGMRNEKGKEIVEVRGGVEKRGYFNVNDLKALMVKANWKMTPDSSKRQELNQNDVVFGTNPLLLNKNTFNQVSPYVAPVAKIEPCAKPSKNSSTNPIITPRVSLSESSFSIIHLLSAVRVALIAPHSGEFLVTNDEANDIQQAAYGGQNPSMDIIIPEQLVLKNLSFFTIGEIEHWVRSNLGDFSILETKTSLRDKVKGVLKLFSSTRAPPGATCWKPLVVYEKSSKTWFWVGPIPSNLRSINNFEEQISPTAWGVSEKTITRLVDSYACWLKSSSKKISEKLEKVASPPQILMQCATIDEKN